MPMKRSRIGRSSSFRDTGVLSPPIQSPDSRPERRAAPPSAASARSPSKSPKVMKPSVAENSTESRPIILSLSSPVQVNVGASHKEPIGQFLDKCYYCQRKIRENSEVYIYLRAFCTVECREKQIAVDNRMEKASGKSEGLQLSPTG
ncbi:FCS-Like Zinc finger 16-like isoform X2 [Diospyros lotus]|uniref:FCS-Like Zinc finger 16-like isoform X2 n=1 Tax=Diospyros lotus TaxID=55363 RepID=UPI00225AA0B4|nr:FCS-Like Zinc finger 16-like isoform X2 [Diospyros lotus]